MLILALVLVVLFVAVFGFIAFALHEAKKEILFQNEYGEHARYARTALNNKALANKERPA